MPPAPRGSRPPRRHSSLSAPPPPAHTDPDFARRRSLPKPPASVKPYWCPSRQPRPGRRGHGGQAALLRLGRVSRRDAAGRTAWSKCGRTPTPTATRTPRGPTPPSSPAATTPSRAAFDEQPGRGEALIGYGVPESSSARAIDAVDVHPGLQHPAQRRQIAAHGGERELLAAFAAFRALAMSRALAARPGARAHTRSAGSRGSGGLRGPCSGMG